jgi:hypothetical protein
MLLVRGKGGKERMVPLSASRREAARPGWPTATGPRTCAAGAWHAALAASLSRHAASRGT